MHLSLWTLTFAAVAPTKYLIMLAHAVRQFQLPTLVIFRQDFACVNAIPVICQILLVEEQKFFYNYYLVCASMMAPCVI